MRVSLIVDEKSFIFRKIKDRGNLFDALKRNFFDFLMIDNVGTLLSSIRPFILLFLLLQQKSNSRTCVVSHYFSTKRKQIKVLY